MISKCFRSTWRILVAITVMLMAGCACMGGGLLEQVVRSGSGQREMSGGMCGGGMMTHGEMAHRAAATQPSEGDSNGAPSEGTAHGEH